MFQTYVKPVLNPQLFPFCTELTGITQEQVDSGIPLSEALAKIHLWLEQNNVLNTEFVFMSCGDYDGRQLR